MKRTEMSRLICQVVSCLCMALAVTSCGNGGDTGAEVGNGKAEGKKATNAVVAVEEPEKLTQVERLEAECRRLVVEPERNQNGKDTLLAINELCKEIRKLPKEEALPLLDRWIEMAIEQPLTYANYSTSAKLPERFFLIAFFSFMASQSMRSDTYGHWDKMFRFFAKYTDEITVEERRIKDLDQLQTNLHQKYKHFRYLHDLQLCTENWVYMITTVYRDILLDRGLTEEQKADILHRLDEVKKYTVPPPNSPYSKK